MLLTCIGDPELLMSFMVEHPEMITLDPKEIAGKQAMMEQIYVSKLWKYLQLNLFSLQMSTWQACTKGGKRGG
jgi:hypothetical protein